jgi:nitroreductase
MFVERWSSKAFTDDRLSEQQIDVLFEAAHWAPSSSNRQPWLFVYATDGPDRVRFNSVLNEGNTLWATRASMLVLVFARVVDEEGSSIRTAHFDTGAAWMSLALQANRMGLNTRAMGGIDLDAAYTAAGVPREEFQTICAIAVGVPGTLDDIDPDIANGNIANDRNPINEIAFPGSYLE